MVHCKEVLNFEGYLHKEILYKSYVLKAEIRNTAWDE